MKKSDLKPGTVYAYKKDSYSDSRPVRLLSTDLMKIRYNSETKRGEFVALSKGDVPGRVRGYSPANIGYLVLIPKTDLGRDILASVDVDEILKGVIEAGAPSSFESDDLKVELYNNRYFTGLWDTFAAAQATRKANLDANNKAGLAWQAEALVRYHDAKRAIQEALGDVILRGMEPDFRQGQDREGGTEHGSYRERGQLVLTLDQMEAIAALLSAK